MALHASGSRPEALPGTGLVTTGLVRYDGSVALAPELDGETMKTKGTAYFLWALGAIGLGGLHRFYLGRSTSGWLYLLTIDLFFVGMILDFKAIPAMVDEANRVLRGGPLMQQNNTQTNQQSVVVNVTAPPVAAAPAQVIKVRCRHCGKLADQDVHRCVECGASI